MGEFWQNSRREERRVPRRKIRKRRITQNLAKIHPLDWILHGSRAPIVPDKKHKPRICIRGLYILFAELFFYYTPFNKSKFCVLLNSSILARSPSSPERIKEPPSTANPSSYRPMYTEIFLPFAWEAARAISSR